ncbi:NAD dependent epimerase/dehydratase family protein [Rubripirellula obstinata]|uniref:NAD dependent epimerase/dehydratase family protein n=1 Tax=Rubripirellula obstinata TaxID=406547 RepID=A0A5B1CGY6_9BACT|nr:SDR family oxidoreductase [Rubripirellula obstinata]KAA1259471.1 NAD dependent epimerase/dehydratase family protein [Rubripirellula obstinata]
MNRSLVVGYGYLGRRVASLAKKNGDIVYATTRNSQKMKSIYEDGIHPIQCDWTDRSSLIRSIGELDKIDRVLVAVAYDRSSQIDRDTAMVGGLGNLIDALRIDPSSAAKTKFCYISTTGVYHQTGGVWVDETSPTRPTRDGGKAHLRAEALLRKKLGPTGFRTLRLSGIYGPGRVPRAADVIAGRPIASPADGYLNLIHVDDAASAVMAAWQLQPGDGHHTYVISDDAPVVRRMFYQHIADLCHAASPTFIDPDKDASVRFRSETNKRIWNRRMKKDLDFKLQFPTHREGLADVLKPEA